MNDERKGNFTRIPAVLPIPGLGTLSFLSDLVAYAPADAFDNEAMAIVLRVMWKCHIKRFFLLDMVVYLVFYILWVFLIDKKVSESDRAISLVLMIVNTLNVLREIWQSDFGRHPGYFSSGWNQIDLASAGLVYGYTIPVVMNGKERDFVPLAVVATLLLTMVRIV